MKRIDDMVAMAKTLGMSEQTIAMLICRERAINMVLLGPPRQEIGIQFLRAFKAWCDGSINNAEWHDILIKFCKS